MQDEDVLFNWAITADIDDESLSHEPCLTLLIYGSPFEDFLLQEPGWSIINNARRFG
jgi:hypothetical protein